MVSCRATQGRRHDGIQRSLHTTLELARVLLLQKIDALLRREVIDLAFLAIIRIQLLILIVEESQLVLYLSVVLAAGLIVVSGAAGCCVDVLLVVLEGLDLNTAFHILNRTGLVATARSAGPLLVETLYLIAVSLAF